MFIFGGDSQDKGIGDIRFVTMLLELKEIYGERVILIIGNRDINKLRLKVELNANKEDQNKLSCIEIIINAISILKEWIYWEDN